MHGEGQGFPPPYDLKTFLVRVVRGPVPRKPLNETKNGRNLAAADVFCHERCMARDRPSPYGTEGTLARDRRRRDLPVSMRVLVQKALWRGTGPRPTVRKVLFPPLNGPQRRQLPIHSGYGTA